MPASSSTAGRTRAASFGGASFARNTAVSTPTGTPMISAPTMPHTLVRMKGRMPNWGSAAVDFQTVPSRKSTGPILMMAGRPAHTI